MKTEERKREAARPKPATTESAPSTPIQATPTPTQTEAPSAPPPDAVAQEGGDRRASQSVSPEDAPAAAGPNELDAAAAQGQDDNVQQPQVNRSAINFLPEYPSNVSAGIFDGRPASERVA